MLEIRPALPTDAETIAALVRQIWAGQVAPDSSGHRETAERVQADLARGYVWLAQTDGVAVGTVRLTRHPHEIGVWEIRRLGVRREYRKTGLGQRLMETALGKAIALGAREVRLAVRYDQPRLLEWYTRFGFVQDPQLRYSSPNPLTPPPFMLRKTLEVSS